MKNKMLKNEKELYVLMKIVLKKGQNIHIRHNFQTIKFKDTDRSRESSARKNKEQFVEALEVLSGCKPSLCNLSGSDVADKDLEVNMDKMVSFLNSIFSTKKLSNYLLMRIFNSVVETIQDGDYLYRREEEVLTELKEHLRSAEAQAEIYNGMPDTLSEIWDYQRAMLCPQVEDQRYKSNIGKAFGVRDHLVPTFIRTKRSIFTQNRSAHTAIDASFEIFTVQVNGVTTAGTQDNTQSTDNTQRDGSQCTDRGSHQDITQPESDQGNTQPTPKKGRGRPPGSRNKRTRPSTVDTPPKAPTPKKFRSLNNEIAVENSQRMLLMA